MVSGLHINQSLWNFVAVSSLHLQNKSVNTSISNKVIDIPRAGSRPEEQWLGAGSSHEDLGDPSLGLCEVHTHGKAQSEASPLLSGQHNCYFNQGSFKETHRHHLINHDSH